MADFTLRYDSATGQLVGEDSNGNEIPIPLNALEVSGSASIDGNVESFTAGHDDVRVPQVRNLTVEDWESGTLDTDVYSKATSDFDVQSGTTLEGSYSLRYQPGGVGDTHINSFNGLDTYPQPGDEFTVYFQSTDAGDDPKFYWCVQSSESVPYEQPSYSLSPNPRDEDITLATVKETNDADRTSIPFSNYLNETIRVEVVHAEDNSNITATAYVDSTDTELGTVSHSPTRSYTSGGISYYGFSENNDSAEMYYDGPFVKRREPEARANTAKGVTELGNEVVPSGAIQTGPMEVPADHPNYPMVNLPVTDDLAQGEQVGYHLAINQDKALTVEAEADGNGGVQNRQVMFEDDYDALPSDANVGRGPEGKYGDTLTFSAFLINDSELATLNGSYNWKVTAWADATYDNIYWEGLFNSANEEIIVLHDSGVNGQNQGYAPIVDANGNFLIRATNGMNNGFTGVCRAEIVR